MKNKDKPLNIEIKDGELVISIGINTLAFAAKHHRDWPEGMEIKNCLKFAKHIVGELNNNEDETGATLIHRAFDEAALNVIEKIDDF